MRTVVCNRTVAGEGVLPLECLAEEARKADIVIYTLPVAIPQIEALRGCTVLEANYKTPCLQSIAGRYIKGTAWLEAQAAQGYSLMTAQI